ncbi:hypothetical protein E9840_06560 [Tissierella creatinini]|nr:hypothetical protein E9840_06560 [Tissierella creatinini]TJX67492.1 hypothetical protein E8P77_04985 [Soehngenia saccharolytica]
MIFQKKIDRAMKWLRDRNKGEDKNKGEDDELQLEKNDLLAIIISALIVFVPILLVLAFIIYLVM